MCRIVKHAVEGQVKRLDGREAVRKANFIENLFGVAA
jgi:hypothetical protein